MQANRPQASPLGYLLAEMAIGPWGWGLIGGVEEMLHFSEFGVLMLKAAAVILLLVLCGRYLLRPLLRTSLSGMREIFTAFALPLQVASLVLGFLALKSAVLYVLGRYFGIARGQQVLFAFLLDRGLPLIERETFEAALLMGGKVLHNFKTLHAVHPHCQDQHQMISLAKQGRQKLEDMFARDAARLPEAGEDAAGSSAD